MAVSSIKLDYKYFQKVRDQIKVTTIRKGHREVGLGKCALVDVDGGNVIDVMVLSVLHVPAKDLDLFDAYYDGFETREELMEDLLTYYPDLTDDDEVTVIGFEMI